MEGCMMESLATGVFFCISMTCALIPPRLCGKGNSHTWLHKHGFIFPYTGISVKEC